MDDTSAVDIDDDTTPDVAIEDLRSDIKAAGQIDDSRHCFEQLGI